MRKCGYTKLEPDNNCYYMEYCPFMKSPAMMCPAWNMGQNYFMKYNCMEEPQYRINEENKQPIITFKAVDIREIED